MEAARIRREAAPTKIAAPSESESDATSSPEPPAESAVIAIACDKCRAEFELSEAELALVPSVPARPMRAARTSMSAATASAAATTAPSVTESAIFRFDTTQGQLYAVSASASRSSLEGIRK